MSGNVERQEFGVACVIALGVTLGLLAIVRGDEPAARIAVTDNTLTVRRAAQPPLPDDFDRQRNADGTSGRGRSGTDAGAAPLRMEASASLLATLRELLGPDGTLTLQPAQSIVIVRPEARVTIPPGTAITYRLDESTGTLTFGAIKPRVEARVLGLRVTPQLDRLDLQADNSAVASVSSGRFRTTRRFRIAWEDGPQSPGMESGLFIDQRPVVSLYTTPGCSPCELAKVELAAAADTLPFRVEVVSDPAAAADAGVDVFPALKWRSPRSSTGWMRSDGWHSVSGLVAAWQSTMPEVP